MDWMNIVRGLGNFGDIGSGKESVNSIIRGNQQNALGRDTLAMNANLQSQQMALSKAMQQAGFLNTNSENALDRSQRDSLQKNQQAFLGDQNFFNRMQDSSNKSSDRAMQMSENAMDRAARLQAEQDRLANSVNLANMQYAQDNQGLTPQMAEVMNMAPGSPLSQVRIAAGSLPGQVGLMKLQGLRDVMKEYGPGGTQSNLRGIPARGPSAPTVRLKLGGNN
jgi:hypothetical protein